MAEMNQFSQYRGSLGYLYLDGKLLELLSVYLGEVLELDILMGKNITMSRTERTAIMETKRIIDSQIAFAPSCKELSRLVHLSVPNYREDFHLSMEYQFINILLTNDWRKQHNYFWMGTGM